MAQKKKGYQSFCILQVRVITLTAHSHHRFVAADVILGNISFAPAFTGFHPIFSFSIETGICVTAQDNEDAALKTKSLARIRRVAAETAALCSPGSLIPVLTRKSWRLLK